MLTSLVAFACVAGLAEGFIGTLPASSRWAPRSPLVTSAGSGKRLLFGRSSSNSSNTSKNGPVVSTMTVSPDVVGVSSSPAGAPEPNKYDLDSWAKAYATADPEDQYVLEPSEGSIPKDIEGTFLRNGPGKFKVGDELVKHPFDGDGMVMAINFSEEGAYFRNRFIQTKGYKKELKAGKQLYRGFSNLPGGILKNAFKIDRKNLANTNVVSWGGQLLALWEGGLPHRLDAKSLETFGESTLGDTIDQSRPTFSAHPRVDVKKKRLVNFGSHNMKETTVYEYDANFKAVQAARLLKEVGGFHHDFGVTENYYLFYTAPVGLTPLKWVLGLETMGSALKWEGGQKDTKMLVVPRDPSKPMKTITVPAAFCFNLANAYEDSKTGELVADLVEASYLVLDVKEDPDRPVWETVDFADIPENSMVRYRLDVSSKQGSLVDRSTLYDAQIEFPMVNPKVSCQEHRYVWASCGILEDKKACPNQGLVKIDTTGEEGTQKWFPEAHEFMSEPTFIPRKGAPVDAPEDFGYIASVLVNGRDHLTEILILDAADLGKGPVCRLPLKGFIPHTLHGEFAEELVFTHEQIEKSFTLTNLFSRKGWNVAKSEFSGLGLNSMMD